MPTPADYTATVLAIIYAIGSGIIIWSLNRNVKKADDEREELRQSIKDEAAKKDIERREILASITKINDEIDRLKENVATGKSDTNEKISELALRISNDIKDLAVKIALGMHINDNNSK